VSTENLMAFLAEIDAELVRHAKEGETLELYLVGRSAMILGFGLAALQTKDVDVIEVKTSHLLTVVSEVFKKDSERSIGYGFYLETLSSGFPPMPAGFEKRCKDVPGPWRVLRLRYPEAHDLIVSKLKRFHSGDREDVQFLCDNENIQEQELRLRFDFAHVFSDRDDPKVEGATENLESVVKYLNGQLRSL
jgi:hypothetical protein